MNYRTDPKKLLSFLSETPICQKRTKSDAGDAPPAQPFDLLWAAKWGVSAGGGAPSPGAAPSPDRETAEEQPSRLQLLENIVGAMANSSSPYNVMVSADYGTGKTSLLRCLKNRLEEEAGQFLTLWLDMPSLTGTTPALTHALVMTAIVDTLTTGGMAAVKPGWQAAVKEIWELDKAMYAHTVGQSSPCPFNSHGKSMSGDAPNTRQEYREEPRRSSLPGATVPERVFKAVRLEKEITEFLQGEARTTIQAGHESGAGSPPTRQMVVFLDDLDRCQRFVPYHVIRLLLRFGGVQGIHFVLACDQEIMAEGARQWMACHGHGSTEDEQTAYSPASALSKYITLQIDLPDLGQPVTDQGTVQSVLDRLEKQAPDRAERIQKTLYVYASLYVRQHNDSTENLRNILADSYTKKVFMDLAGNDYFTMFLVALLENIDPIDFIQRSADEQVQSSFSVLDQVVKQGGSPSVIPEDEFVEEELADDSGMRDAQHREYGLADDAGARDDQSKKNVLIPASVDKETIKKNVEGVVSQGKPSNVYDFLQNILRWNETAKRWEVSGVVKKLSGFLTLRQVKSWFRHMLMEPSQEEFFHMLIRRNFPWVYQLKEKNWPGLQHLCLLSRNLTQLGDPYLWGVVDKYFGDQLDGILKTNNMNFSMQDVWPRKTKEQRLLLALLTVTDFREQDSFHGLNHVVDVQRFQRPVVNVHTDDFSTPIQQPDWPANEGKGWEALFDVFCKKWFGKVFEGNPDEKLSQLDDAIGESPARKHQAFKILNEYYQSIWPHHKRLLRKNQMVSVSLANLGDVLSEDAPGGEHLAVVFFQFALHRGGDSGVRNDYAEALLDYLADDNRLENLTRGRVFGIDADIPGDAAAKIRDQIREILKDPSVWDPIDEFRRQTVFFQMERESFNKKPSRDMVPHVRAVVKGLAPMVMRDLYGHNGTTQIVRYLDIFLDRVLGIGATLLSARTSILLPFWGVAEREAISCQILNDYPNLLGPREIIKGRLEMIKLIANNVIGQSDHKSVWEVVGVGLSRYLLGIPSFVYTNRKYASRIFTQVMVVVVKHGIQDASVKASLCALAALHLYGEPDAVWIKRVKSVWDKLNFGPWEDDISNITQTLFSRLSGDSSTLLENYRGWWTDENAPIEYCTDLLDKIFGKDFPAICDYAQFYAMDQWTGDEREGMDEQTRIICLGLPWMAGLFNTGNLGERV
ncbi:MAG: KAP family NTPase [Magnetococcus sp. DMHC-8]